MKVYRLPRLRVLFLSLGCLLGMPELLAKTPEMSCQLVQDLRICALLPGCYIESYGTLEECRGSLHAYPPIIDELSSAKDWPFSLEEALGAPDLVGLIHYRKEIPDYVRKHQITSKEFLNTQKFKDLFDHEEAIDHFVTEHHVSYNRLFEHADNYKVVTLSSAELEVSTKPWDEQLGFRNLYETLKNYAKFKLYNRSPELSFDKFASSDLIKVPIHTWNLKTYNFVNQLQTSHFNRIARSYLLQHAGEFANFVETMQMKVEDLPQDIDDLQYLVNDTNRQFGDSSAERIKSIQEQFKLPLSSLSVIARIPIWKKLDWMLSFEKFMSAEDAIRFWPLNNGPQGLESVKALHDNLDIPYRLIASNLESLEVSPKQILDLAYDLHIPVDEVFALKDLKKITDLPNNFKYMLSQWDSDAVSLTRNPNFYDLLADRKEVNKLLAITGGKHGYSFSDTIRTLDLHRMYPNYPSVMMFYRDIFFEGLDAIKQYYRSDLNQFNSRRLSPYLFSELLNYEKIRDYLKSKGADKLVFKNVDPSKPNQVCTLEDDHPFAVDEDDKRCFEFEKNEFVYSKAQGLLIERQTNFWNQTQMLDIVHARKALPGHLDFPGTERISVRDALKSYQEGSFMGGAGSSDKFPGEFEKPDGLDSALLRANLINYAAHLLPKSEKAMTLYRGIGGCQQMNYITKPQRFWSTSASAPSNKFFRILA